MSDTKLREKADALIAFTQLGPRFIAWVEAVTDALAPAPEKAAKVECPNCGEMTERSHSRYEGPGPDKWACQPAPPEPAAREMPEAVRDAVDTLRSGVPSYPTWRQYADTLESWWRNLAQPVAVGMTEELEHVLSIAERDLRYKEECFDDSARTVHDERIERLRAAIAAVRQQAAQGRKVELGKVRELIEWEVKNNGSGLWAAALAELDAAEGKERE